MSLEKQLDKLRKKPANKICPNCATQDRYGFKNCCVKYDTFVCSNCKAAHQAFSHRMKGITMSTFTREEVDRLHDRGNVAAERTWLGKLSREDVERMAPSKEDRPEVWHRWIERIYERREFFLSEDEQPRRQSRAREDTAPPRHEQPRAERRRAEPRGHQSRDRVSSFGELRAAAPSSSTFDDFNDFNSSATPTAGSFDDGFDVFSAAAAPAAAPVPASAPAHAPIARPADDGFGAFSRAAAPSQAAASSFGFDAFQSSAPAPMAPTSVNSFESTFGLLAPTPTTAPVFAPAPAPAPVLAHMPVPVPAQAAHPANGVGGLSHSTAPQQVKIQEDLFSFGSLSVQPSVAARPAPSAAASSFNKHFGALTGSGDAMNGTAHQAAAPMSMVGMMQQRQPAPMHMNMGATTAAQPGAGSFSQAPMQPMQPMPMQPMQYSQLSMGMGMPSPAMQPMPGSAPNVNMMRQQHSAALASIGVHSSSPSGSTSGFGQVDGFAMFSKK